jgi:hypothetical protein
MSVEEPSASAKRLIHKIKSGRDGSFLERGQGSFAMIDTSGGEEAGEQPNDYDGILGMQAEESHIISSNVETSILELQEVLKYTPFTSKIDKNPKFDLEPLLEAEVRIQKSTLTDVEWRSYWMVVVDTILYLRYDRKVLLAFILFSELLLDGA